MRSENYLMQAPLEPISMLRFVLGSTGGTVLSVEPIATRWSGIVADLSGKRITAVFVGSAHTASLADRKADI